MNPLFRSNIGKVFLPYSIHRVGLSFVVGARIANGDTLDVDFGCVDEELFCQGGDVHTRIRFACDEEVVALKLGEFVTEEVL